jgi:MoaA/NifB/PqqE/SkfB family radical SAM enzyme
VLAQCLDQATESGLKKVAFTGGEAGLHPDFGDLVCAVTDRGLRFSLVSNGYEWERYAGLPRLHGDAFDHISFSLDSHKADTHDSLRRPGSYRRVVDAIRHFREAGVDVHVSICLGRRNRHHVRRFARFAARMGVARISFLSVIPTPWNTDLVLSDRQRRSCYRAIRRARKRLDCNVRITSSLKVGKGRRFCRALELECMALNQAGELLFCCDFEGQGGILGSVVEEGIPSLLQRGREVAVYLEEARAAHLQTRTRFKGFDTCRFCYTWLPRRPR